MLTRQLLLAASLALLAGCGSDKVTTVTGLNGAVSFTYSGAVSGTYSATGALPSGNFETTTWSAGVISQGAVFVESATPASSSSHNFVFIAIPRTTTGSSPIDPECSDNVCGEMFFELGAPNSGSANPTQTCILDAGTITITEITSSRVKGTFTGTAGTCLSSNQTLGSFTVTNGSFDVALVSNIP